MCLTMNILFTVKNAFQIFISICSKKSSVQLIENMYEKSVSRYFMIKLFIAILVYMYCEIFVYSFFKYLN